jgi:LysM repeat protein
MPQTLVYILIVFVLFLPVLGAIGLRVAGPRINQRQRYGAATGIFGLALLSALVLARSDVPSLQIGRLSILLPVSAPGDDLAARQADLPTPDVPLEVSPVATAPSVPSPAPAATAAPPPLTPTGTPAPSATPAPTTAPTAAPSATPAPTTAPTATAQPAAPAQRKYTVEAGDTLRSIATKFDVSVQAIIDANKLTPQEADSLRVGQELIIP